MPRTACSFDPGRRRKDKNPMGSHLPPSPNTRLGKYQPISSRMTHGGVIFPESFVIGKSKSEWRSRLLCAMRKGCCTFNQRTKAITGKTEKSTIYFETGFRPSIAEKRTDFSTEAVEATGGLHPLSPLRSIQSWCADKVVGIRQIIRSNMHDAPSEPILVRLSIWPLAVYKEPLSRPRLLEPYFPSACSRHGTLLQEPLPLEHPLGQPSSFLSREEDVEGLQLAYTWTTHVAHCARWKTSQK